MGWLISKSMEVKSKTPNLKVNGTDTKSDENRLKQRFKIDICFTH